MDGPCSLCSAFEGDQGATQYSAKSAKKGQIGSRLLTQPPPSTRHTDDDDDDYTMAQRKHGRARSDKTGPRERQYR